MRGRADGSLPLHGWTVLSLRPRGQHGGLRAAAKRAGARLLALSPHAIECRDDTRTRAALREALAADIVVFTSPNAVRNAAALQQLAPGHEHGALAIGIGTRSALRRLGIKALAPARMDSEGLLAMPALVDVAGRRVGLVTGTGGRNLLAPVLRERGALLTRADVYCRVPVAFSARAQARLALALATPQRALVVISSAEALAGLLAQTPLAIRDDMSAVAVIAASARLGQSAAEAGFSCIAIAASARPAALLCAAADAFV